MTDRASRYLESTAELLRVTARCDGLIADVQHRQDALLRWQECVATGAPPEVLERALADFLDGEPPSWTRIRQALAEWVGTSQRARELWAGLAEEDRGALESPVIRDSGEDG